MTIRGDSYGSLEEVAALTRHLLRGQTVFNSTTYPQASEVEKFIDRVSSTLNVAVRNVGLTSPITANSTAVLDADNFVVAKSAEYVEMTIRGGGSRRAQGEVESLGGFLSGLTKAASEFVDEHRLGWSRLGVGVANPLSQGLAYTGETAQKDRVDPDDSSIEQPKFTRNQFDNPRVAGEDD